MEIKKFTSLLVATTFFGIFSCGSAFATLYHMPKRGNDIVGENYYVQVRRRDSATTVRMRYKVSKHELFEANPSVNFRRLKVGQRLLIPMQFILPPYRRGITLNMAELRLYYFTPDGKYVFTTPVGMGRTNWRTPTMITKVVRKTADPTWHVPKSIKEHTLKTRGILLPDAVPPGPKNPLGKYALYLQRNGYLIHGTNRPATVGTFASSGCMRLWADPIEMLYEDVVPGTKVYVIHHANKAGWLNGKLYLECHQRVNLHRASTLLNNMEVENAIFNAIKFRNANIDWGEVHNAEDTKTGIPTVIGYAK